MGDVYDFVVGTIYLSIFFLFGIFIFPSAITEAEVNLLQISISCMVSFIFSMIIVYVTITNDVKEVYHE